MKAAHKKLLTAAVRLVAAVGLLVIAGAVRADSRPALGEVLVYPTASDGSLMDWLSVSPLQYDAAYIGDSLSYDPLKGNGETELTVTPRAGDQVQGKTWTKEHFTGTVQGPTMCDLFQVAGYSWNYGITASCAYIYSPSAHPNAMIFGSSDDGLKAILNGKVLWKNQIQRSPTYDGDQFAAPLNQGWNRLLFVVDQVIGGHLMCGRFMDGGKPILDLQISLDPPAPDAKRDPADRYNQAADDLARHADDLKAAGSLDNALAAYKQVDDQYPLADVAPRAAYSRAEILYSPAGDKSLGEPQQAADALEALIATYPGDLRAQYADLDLAQIQDQAEHNRPRAEQTYGGFESLFPTSPLASKALVELARLQAEGKDYDAAILTYHRVINQFPASDEVMTATLGIADVYRFEGDTGKARKQYAAAGLMAQDWYDNKYGVDVGKQAWLRGLMDLIRVESASLPAH